MDHRVSGYYRTEYREDCEAVKHIYFVAETKGEANTLQFQDANLRGVEKAKKKCAEEHFKAISTDKVKYGVVSSYEELYSIVSH